MGKLNRLEAPLARILQSHPISTFVETGTFYGESLEYALTLPFRRWHSVELSSELHRRAVVQFSDRPQLTLHRGDSVAVLPTILDELDAAALFWLDAHWCFLDTARGPKDCPLLDEIELIAAHERSRGVDHVIIADDFHIFGTGPQSPWLVNDDVVFVPEADWTAVTVDAIREQLADRGKQFHVLGDALFMTPARIDMRNIPLPLDPYATAMSLTSERPLSTR
jgi:hypothetical protein